jgi:hypothetical protein
MQVSFRQGIIKAQNAGWLTKTNSGAATVDINASPLYPVVISFAHYSANYLFTLNTNTITNHPQGGWGYGNPPPGGQNGALPASGHAFLYWDIDLSTGALAYGWTAYAPIVSSSQPVGVYNDQHWFDTTNVRMRVYRQVGSNPGIWQDKVRLFAGSWNSGTLTVNGTGTQVGITGGPFETGDILYGTNSQPLKQSDGTFVTTSSQLMINQTNGQNVQLDAAVYFAEASTEIPAFYLVYYQPNGQIGLCSSNAIGNWVGGMVVQPLAENSVGRVIVNGIIRNDQWPLVLNLGASINAPVFLDPYGNISVTPPTAGFVQQVGMVVSADTILLNIFPPVILS